MTTALMEKPAPSAIESRDAFRKQIFELESVMAKIPGATFGDSPEMPLKHSFAEGVYVREIFIPKGHILTGKIHKHSHPNFLMKGEVVVVTEERGREHLKAPLSMISAAGTKRAVIAMEDTVWVTVHSNPDNLTDLGELEEIVIAKDYKEYEAFKKLHDPENNFGIYLICNSANGKMYVGSSKNIDNRWRVHKSQLRRNIHSNQIIQNAWNKYGESCFTFSILQRLENESDLLVREQFWIDTVKPAYNICMVAGRTSGIRQSLEQRQNTSRRLLGNKYAFGVVRVQTPETREKISLTLMGTRHSPESYMAQADKVRGRKLSQETREKLSLAQKKRRSLEKILAYDLSQRNCLILALKEKGRDYKCLMELTPSGNLLPFTQAIEKLKAAGVSIDGLFGEKVTDTEWHVTTGTGTPLSEIVPGDHDMVGTWGGVAIGAGAIGSAVIGNMGKKKQEQVPLETAEQRAARRKLMGFADTGTFGNFTAGAEVPLGYGDYNMTGIEGQGQSALQDLLNQGLPSQYAAGDAALADYLKTDPTDIAAQYDPFKAQVQRQMKESDRALKRNAGFAGNLYSTDTIRNMGDIQARGNETLTSEMARLTDNALQRRLQAIPLAYQSAESQQAAKLNQIGASQQYGGLTRQLNDASIKARDAELLRRRQELQLPIQAAQTVAGQTANYGVPSINTSPYGDLLGLVGQIGGQYLSNRQSDNQMQRYFPNGGGSQTYGQSYGFDTY